MNSSRANSVDSNHLNTPTNEHVASFIWGSGHLSAAFYNTSSMELYVTHEAVDLKPDFWHLKNLFRQMKMVNVLASGPPIFLQEIMKMLGLPDKSDPSLYRVNRLKTLTAAEFIVYTNNEKTLISSRKRILELELPRMTAEFNEQDRYNFLSALLPLHQHLSVQCLGNLLNYLDANWKHLFLRNDHRPIITDIHVHALDEQVLMDESTFEAMKIFAAKDHPSGFKMCAYGSSKEGCSFYNIINNCVSRIGSNELKIMMQRPTRDVNELQLRFATIEWCRMEQNATHLTRIKSYLRNVGNIGELYGKLVKAQDQPMLWKSFKRTLYYANCVWEYCVHLIATKMPDIDGTLIAQIGNHMKDNNVLENMLNHIEIIVDLEESLKLSKFCVNFGLDDELDAKKDTFFKVINLLSAKTAEEINNLPEYVNELTVHCVNEMGFLIGERMQSGSNFPFNFNRFFSVAAFPSMGQDVPPACVQNTRLNFMYKTKDTFFFNTDFCIELNEKYGHLYVEISEREQYIRQRLLEHIYVYLAGLQHNVRFCAKLDALISMAAFSIDFKLTQPEMFAEGKTLEITGGRHILIDMRKKFVPNDTNINVTRKNLINILIAPNASGKSVYMKQLAQIVYLAHIGSYVPAEAARISIIDAIYTRIYSPESMYEAKSSFLIEMGQMGNLMTNSSSISLILVDELGQGTNALDGKALLLSCLEHLCNRGEASPIAVISTHYTDVYDFMHDREWINMKTFEVTHHNDGSVFSTFKIVDGKCIDNYAMGCGEVHQFLKRVIGGNSSSRSTSNQSSVVGSTRAKTAVR